MEICSLFFIPVGLLLDILGIVLLFVYGLPSKIEHLYSDMAVEINDNEKQRIIKKNKRISFLSHFGLVALILGFCLQFAGYLCQVMYIPSCGCGCQ